MAIEISAILTTYNRAHYLPLVLGALAKQTLPRDQFEIIVINDGSTDDTLLAIERHRHDLPVKIFNMRHSGLASAKNLGVFAAQAPIVVFLDDDDVLDPNALRMHLLAHQAHPQSNQAILAHTDMAPDVLRSPVMNYVVNTAGSLFWYAGLSQSKVYGWREFWGGRSSCKRAFLIENGMFTPEFRFGYEDIECGWRLNSYGLQVFYEPAARSTMVRSITFDGFCTRSYRQGVAAHHFYQLHSVAVIGEYLQVDDTLALWSAHWRSYAHILRMARSADENASQLGVDLDETGISRLGTLYRDAFRLSFAKGFNDAASLATRGSPSRSAGYGLPPASEPSHDAAEGRMKKAHPGDGQTAVTLPRHLHHPVRQQANRLDQGVPERLDLLVKLV